MDDQLDVLVVGGGPAGTSIAIHLASCGLRVRIIERGTFPRARIGESLPPKIEPLLSILGVRRKVVDVGFARMTGTTVFQGAQIETHDFHPEQRQLGFQVERARFDQLLLDRARDVGCQVIEQCALTELRTEGDRVIGAQIKDELGERELRPRFVVDATGAAAVVAKALALRRRDSIRTVALSAYWSECKVPSDFPATNTLFEMMPDGWIWSVLRSDGLRNVTIGVDAELVKEGRSTSALYERQVRRSTLVAPLIERATLQTKINAHDATWSSSLRYAGDGFLLCGDAASFIDPLTSQGVYKALQSGVVGASVINTVINRPSDKQLALDYYEDSQARFASNYAEIAQTFYLNSPFRTAPFWAARCRAQASVSTSDHEVKEGLSRRRALLKLLEKHSAKSVLVRAKDLKLETRPLAEGHFIQKKIALVSKRGSIDIQRLDPAVLLMMLDGRSVESVFEDYASAAGEPRSSELGRRLMATLIRLAEDDHLDLTVSV